MAPFNEGLILIGTEEFKFYYPLAKLWGSKALQFEQADATILTSFHQAVEIKLFNWKGSKKGSKIPNPVKLSPVVIVGDYQESIPTQWFILSDPCGDPR